MKTDWGLWSVRAHKYFDTVKYLVFRKRDCTEKILPDHEREEIFDVFDDEESARQKAMELNKDGVTIQRRKLCRLLLPVLQETANLTDLTNLRYDQATECVIATFQNGARKRANIACDSGTAAIVDIIRQIT